MLKFTKKGSENLHSSLWIVGKCNKSHLDSELSVIFNKNKFFSLILHPVTTTPPLTH